MWVFRYIDNLFSLDRASIVADKHKTLIEHIYALLDLKSVISVEKHGFTMFLNLQIPNPQQSDRYLVYKMYYKLGNIY